MPRFAVLEAPRLTMRAPMNDVRTDGSHPQLQAGERGRLDSWKKIAAHVRTGAERQISQLVPDTSISDFDLSPDGSVILFERIQESSRIAPIERGGSR
jgi:hypothetical protein